MLLRLIDQMFDANRAVIGYLHGLVNPPPELMRLASHVLQAETIWLCRIEGRPTPPNAFQAVPLDRLHADNDANHAGYAALLEGDTDRRISYKTFDGVESESTVTDIMLHVVTHGYHHRGQMASLCSQNKWAGFPNTAYIVYARRLGI